MGALIMHVDMDAFFAAIEQRDRPELRGKPVVVGAQPGSRGVVSTCSYEARRFGLRSAMPISEAFRRCPQAHYLSPDMSRYAEVSDQVMDLLEQVSPVVEPVSIDEAFLDLGGLTRLFGGPVAIGRRAKQLVLDELDLNMSVGIGPNRLVAKIASDHQKPDGLTFVPEAQVLDFLAPLPVRVLRGVGKKLGAQVEAAGLHKVAQLRRLKLDELQRRFGERAGESLYAQARGQASSQVAGGYRRKSISQERTFQEDVGDAGVLRDKLLRLAAGVGRIARRKGFRARVVNIKLRLASFETHTRQTRLERATNLDEQIFQTAWRLYQDSGFVDRPLRLIGVGLSDWAEGGGEQLGLFDRRVDREEKLYGAIDALKDRFGASALGFGAAGQVAPSRAEARYAAGAPTSVPADRDGER